MIVTILLGVIALFFLAMALLVNASAFRYWIQGDRLETEEMCWRAGAWTAMAASAALVVGLWHILWSLIA